MRLCAAVLRESTTWCGPVLRRSWEIARFAMFWRRRQMSLYPEIRAACFSYAVGSERLGVQCRSFIWWNWWTLPSADYQPSPYSIASRPRLVRRAHPQSGDRTFETGLLHEGQPVGHGMREHVSVEHDDDPHDCSQGNRVPHHEPENDPFVSDLLRR
jgi:hypothetical protein